LTGRAETRAFTHDALAAELAAGDVVVSMLPAVEHPALLRLAIGRGAHFTCSSYLSAGIAEQAEDAAARGLVVLTELGLDPGIDHLLSHELVRRAKAITDGRPATVRFTSYCGSNPSVPNDFRYRFSCAMRRPDRLAYPGADDRRRRGDRGGASMGIGTAAAGQRRELRGLPQPGQRALHRDLPLPGHLAGGDLRPQNVASVGLEQGLGAVFEELPQASEERITELAADLAQRYPTSDSDHDRVIMSVKLEVKMDNGERWTGEYVLDAVGTQEFEFDAFTAEPLERVLEEQKLRPAVEALAAVGGREP
jgi:hypothetical protein